MNLLEDKPSQLFRKFLYPSLGSAMIMSIYTMVDAIAIGKGVGPLGLSALNITTPLLCILMSTGLLFGIGGASLMSFHFGKSNPKDAKNIFTISFIGVLSCSILYWFIYSIFFNQLATLLGATPLIFNYVKDYMFWINIFIPVITCSNFLSAFVRNDNDPSRAMIGVISGGIVNIFLDYLLVFPINMGIGGAALASAIGMCFSSFIMTTHFLTKRNQLCFIRPFHIFKNLRAVLSSGMPSFLNEFANGLIVCLFNIQILRYADETTLSVYGVIANCAILFTSLFSGVGQAAQPLISTNYGSERTDRINLFKKYGFISVIIMGALFSSICIIYPNTVTRLFMNPTAEIQNIANEAIRIYSAAFFFMGINLFASYYFQSILQPIKALIVSILRSILLSCSFVYIFPIFFSTIGIWYVMPVTEFITLIAVIYLLHVKSNR